MRTVRETVHDALRGLKDPEGELIPLDSAENEAIIAEIEATERAEALAEFDALRDAMDAEARRIPFEWPQYEATPAEREAIQKAQAGLLREYKDAVREYRDAVADGVWLEADDVDEDENAIGVALRLPNATVSKLKELERRYNKDSAAEIVRDAIAVYVSLIEARDRGLQIFSRDELSEQEERIWLPSDPPPVCLSV